MSRARRQARLKKRLHDDGVKVPDPKPGVQRVVRRVIITQTLQRQSDSEQWASVNVNLDCGGMTAEDAAKLAYIAASGIMKQLAASREPVKVRLPKGTEYVPSVEGVTDVAELVGAGGEARVAGRDSDAAEGGEVARGDPVTAAEVGARCAEAKEQAFIDGMNKETTDGAADLQDVRRADPSGATESAAGSRHVRGPQ